MRYSHIKPSPLCFAPRPHLLQFTDPQVRLAHVREVFQGVGHREGQAGREVGRSAGEVAVSDHYGGLHMMEEALLGYLLNRLTLCRRWLVL